MPIDLLGGEAKKPIKKKTADFEVRMHLPKKEEIKKEKERVKIKKERKEEEAKEEFQEVNLLLSFRRYLLKKYLVFSALFVIIIVAGFLIYAGYVYFFPKLPPAPLLSNENANEPVAVIEPPIEPPLIQPSPLPEPPAPPPPLPSPIPEPVLPPEPLPELPLPDTELAPLRGSVVKFIDSENLYLVEDNGELRLIDVNTVIFKNGQRADQLSPRLIYTLADRYQYIRRGKDVKGQVDWDPRVLIPEELELFL
ncbi:MAG TPA: hypothetical protein ENN28_02220 [Candidatus Uhrbacteria bacterium]|nr:hypothetical protein [Candidatus Uhrbacteria bacterium]